MEEYAEGDDAGEEPLLPATVPTLHSLLASLGPLLAETSPSRSQHAPDNEIRALQAYLEAKFEPFELLEMRDMVLEQMITVESTLTGDNTDFLAGTQLDQPGVPGVYTIWAASTVGDTQMSVTLGGRTVVNAMQVVLRANSEIRENEDNFQQVASRTGGRPVININVITAAVVRVRVKFLPAMRT